MAKPNGVVVTGASGFIGKVLCEQIKLLYPKMPFLEIDIKTGNDITTADTLNLIGDFKPYVLFHLAAHHFIPWCNEHPLETMRLNAAASRQLFYAARASKVVMASSAAVYGLAGDAEHGHTELCPPMPDDVYGLSKVWAEQAMLQYCNQAKAGTIAARLFNVVGERGQDETPHLHPKVMERAGKEMTCSIPNLAEHRDYVHVDDCVRSLIDLAEHIVRPGFAAVNVCTGVTLTGAEMCSLYDVKPVDDPTLHRPSKGHLRGSNAYLLEMTKRAPTAPWERLLWGR